MPTLAIRGLRVMTEWGDGGGQVAREAANQTFKRGNLIQPTTAAADGSVVYTESAAGASAGSKLAIALRDAQNLANPTLPLWVLPTAEDLFFEITASGAVLTSALLNGAAEYGLAKDATTGFHTLNLADTTNTVFRVIDFVPNDFNGRIGDTNPRVLAKLLAARRL